MINLIRPGTIITKGAEMRRTSTSIVRQVISLLLVVYCTARVAAADPLPSWNDGPTKKAITDFVAEVTTDGSPDFVKPEDRIAAFDNDGTLWCEQPMYFQGLFAFDEVKRMAPDHPD